MIKYFLFSISILTTTVSVAQKVTIGKHYGVIDADDKLYFAQNNEILTIKTERKSVTIQKMNAVTLAFKSIKLYDDFPKGFALEKISRFKDRYYLFYSQYDGEQEQLF